MMGQTIEKHEAGKWMMIGAAHWGRGSPRVGSEDRQEKSGGEGQAEAAEGGSDTKVVESP